MLIKIKKPTSKDAAPKVRRKSAALGFEKALSKVSKKLKPALHSLPDARKEKPDASDKRGHHNKINPPSSDHMKKIRAMRQIYGKQTPRLQCNTCQFSTNCPSFKAGYECAYTPFLAAHKIDSLEDIIDSMRNVVGANMQRLHLASLFERLSGGMPSSELNEGYAMMLQQLATLKEAEQGTPPTVSTKGKDSIIGSLFGNINILVQTTGSHREEIAADMAGVIVEDGDTLALHAGEESLSVDALVTELQNPDVIASSKKLPKTIPQLAQGVIKK
jgi:hypothetical protein